jgi:hypothetical protein
MQKKSFTTLCPDANEIIQLGQNFILVKKSFTSVLFWEKENLTVIFCITLMVLCTFHSFLKRKTVLDFSLKCPDKASLIT